jgi:hypothetical protein
MNNWKTSLAGVGAICVAIGGALVAIFDGNAATNVDIPLVLAAITAGVGLIIAKDS